MHIYGMYLCQEFELNVRGRDFAVGDLHGMYGMLDMALKKIGFDETRDRLFSVGDLINRGPESVRATEFLGKPWFHAVRGNHEEMFLNLFDDRTGDFDYEGAMLYGRHADFAWVHEVDLGALQAMAAHMRKLPYVMSVQGVKGVTGVVHGEVPIGMSWGDFKAEVNNGCGKALSGAIYGRQRINGEIKDPINGVSRLFVGHSVSSNGVRVLGNICYIDTGAYKTAYVEGASHGLTVVDINTGKSLKTRMPQNGLALG